MNADIPWTDRTYEKPPRKHAKLTRKLQKAEIKKFSSKVDHQHKNWEANGDFWSKIFFKYFSREPLFSKACNKKNIFFLTKKPWIFSSLRVVEKRICRSYLQWLPKMDFRSKQKIATLSCTFSWYNKRPFNELDMVNKRGMAKSNPPFDSWYTWESLVLENAKLFGQEKWQSRAFPVEKYVLFFQQILSQISSKTGSLIEGFYAAFGTILSAWENL